MLFLALAAGCGYRAGFDRFAGVRTVAVPVFANRTEPYRREVQVDLTEAVVRELQARTPYSVVARREEADAVLLGEVLAFSETPLVEGRQDEVLQSSVALTVDVRLVDRRGLPLVPTRRVTDQASFLTLRGENVDTARREALQEIAERVIFELETGWEE